MGIGEALTLAVMVALEEAEEVWVVAAAPVRARTTTKARTMFFMEEPLLNLCLGSESQFLARTKWQKNLVLSDTAGAGSVWIAGGNRQNADASNRDLVRGGGRGGLGGGDCTGKGQDDDESADDVLHVHYLESCIYLERFRWTCQLE
jgi:hypothetical protein